MRFDWSASSLSDVGLVRSGNEDSTFINVDAGVFIVADGMGGRAAGEVASGIATHVIGGAASAAHGCTDDLRESLCASFLSAGEEVVFQAREDSTRSGMGTTCTVLMLRDCGEYLVGHIGDTRAYLLRDGVLTRVTKDHSWVQDQVDRGLIEPAEARGHPASNLITRAIGVDATPTPDLYSGDIRDGDVFLLASDGLTDMIDDQQISAMLTCGDSLDERAECLIREANDAGGFDNITVLLVEIRLLEP